MLITAIFILVPSLLLLLATRLGKFASPEARHAITTTTLVGCSVIGLVTSLAQDPIKIVDLSSETERISLVKIHDWERIREWSEDHFEWREERDDGTYVRGWGDVDDNVKIYYDADSSDAQTIEKQREVVYRQIVRVGPAWRVVLFSWKPWYWLKHDKGPAYRCKEEPVTIVHLAKTLP